MNLGGKLLMYLSSLLALVGIWLIVVISPGPNFVTTVHHAISHSRRDGIFIIGDIFPQKSRETKKSSPTS
jgi:hypothetical protein